uniref:TAF3 RNA polymerase II TATA box binding protein n=1 Tax=Echinococcus granulosus TaxID=6210 RepID=A0A068WEB2_ECHGR|nr:TAF3 RNA polymerase II TATA box binding protein [Echinococcus granulosus]
MPTQILKQTLSSVVGRVAQHVGFEFASMDAIDILSEILFKYLKSISKSVADLAAEDGYFSVVDGLTILELMNESLSGLVKYARESGSYFPKPPNMCIPLAGRIEFSVLFKGEKPLPLSSYTLREPLCSKDVTELLTENKAESTSGQTSTAPQGRHERKLPLWAGRAKYKLARVIYDSSLASLVERDLPPPVNPVIPSTKGLSVRSAVSAFRKPQRTPQLSDSDYPSAALVVHSTKPACTTDVMRESALKTFALSSPQTSRKIDAYSSPSTSLNTSDATLAKATPLLHSADPNSLYPPSIVGKSRKLSQSTSRRNPQNRKKRFGIGRRRSQSIGKRNTNQIMPSMSPVIETAEATKDANHLTPSDREDGSAAPILADVPSLCPSPEVKPSVRNSDNVKLDSENVETHASDVYAAALNAHCSPSLPPKPSITPMPEQSSALGDSGAFGSPLRIPDGTVSFPRRSPTTPQSPAILTETELLPTDRGVEGPFITSSSNDRCLKSDDVYSPVSNSCTEPLTNEELSRDYEMPRAFNFPPTRRSSFSPSSSSLSSSSPSSSSSSPVTDSSKLPVPSVPLITSSSHRISSRLPIQQPLSDHSSRASSSLPGSMASRQPTGVTSYAAEPVKIPHPATAGAGSGIRIKIRLGGPDGETLSVRSSEPAFTNTNSSLSTSSSSSVSSPLSSGQVSDEETAARRHSAIPPALVAKERRHENLSSFGSLISKTQLRATSMSQQPLLSVKTPKLVIKFGGHEHGSTSIVRSLGQQIPQLKPAFTHEKLRGSSISSMGSSSSSSSSQTSDDEEETVVSRPPHLPVLERLPSARNSNNRSSQPPALLLLKDPSSKATSFTSECRKSPPHLRPLNILPPPIPMLTPSFVVPKSTTYSSASSYEQRSNKSSSKCGKKRSRERPMSQSPPKLGVSHSTCGKRVLVNSIFSDDEEEDAIASTGDRLSVRPRDSHRSHKQDRCGAKTRRLGGDKPQTSSQISPPTTQIIAASAGTSYYFNNAGEQIWLCPICRTEDDGNLMVGCDSCDDWYHSSCLGLSKEPDSAQWFCPKCLRERLEKSTTSSGNSKRRSRKSANARHCRR